MACGAGEVGRSLSGAVETLEGACRIDVRLAGARLDRGATRTERRTGVTSVARLRRLTREEVAWRTRTAARIQRDRVAVKLRASQWDRHSLLQVLGPEARRSVADAVERGDWPSAQRQLA